MSPIIAGDLIRTRLFGLEYIAERTSIEDSLTVSMYENLNNLPRISENAPRCVPLFFLLKRNPRLAPFPSLPPSPQSAANNSIQRNFIATSAIERSNDA